MKLAREVDGLSWADRVCNGEAILIDTATPPAATPAAPSEVTDEQIGAAFYVWCPYDGKQRNDRELFAAGYRAALAQPAPVAAPAPASEAVAFLHIDQKSFLAPWPDYRFTPGSVVKSLPVGTYKLYAAPPQAGAGNQGEVGT